MVSEGGAVVAWLHVLGQIAWWQWEYVKAVVLHSLCTKSREREIEREVRKEEEGEREREGEKAVTRYLQGPALSDLLPSARPHHLKF
jgi:hypothetical protein